MISSLRNFDTSEVAQERLRIINFYDQYGEKATKQAFGADRKVIGRWRVRLKVGNGHLSALAPYSTRPHHTRTPVTNPLIVEFIRQQREPYPIGKEKLKPDVDAYCLQINIPTISGSTIGNIIKRNHFFYQRPTGKIYHDPSSAWATKSVNKKKRLRMKHSPKPEEYGHIISDTVEKVVDGVKRYFMSAIDIKLKFALTLEYPRITSTNMKDFYFRFKEVYPNTVRLWQSDNGSENLGIFDQQLEEDKIPHYFIYPNCPQIDTFIERYNRTLQEEFLDYHLDELIDIQQGNKLLVDWNIHYNTKRRHHSLGLLSPIQYLIEKGEMSQMSLTYTIS